MTTPDGAGALRLRIPEPARGHRPADRVHFISKAGEMKKPALDEKVERVALMRKQLLRVLDDDGTAVGEWRAGAFCGRQAGRAAEHDAGAEFRRTAAAVAPPGQDLVLYAVARGGGD